MTPQPLVSGGSWLMIVMLLTTMIHSRRNRLRQRDELPHVGLDRVAVAADLARPADQATP